MSLVVGYSSESESDVPSSKPGTGNNYDESSTYNSSATDALNPVPNENSKNKRINSLVESNSSSKRKRRKGKGPWASWSSSEDENEVNIDQKISEESYTGSLFKEDDSHLLSKENQDVLQDESVFHGKSAVDYQGRGFLYPPIEENVDFLKPERSFRCYLPKKLIHTYPGHKNGTNSILLLPKSGHLCLSAGNDNQVKIWDLYRDRELLRDYRGHSKAVRGISFNSEGSEFLSVSFDQQIKIWDTETGKVRHQYSYSCIPNCAEFRPSNSNEFIVGLSNSEIRHYDLRTSHKNGLVQVYDHHLSSIIALKYFPDGSKFVSSSEDKSMRIWENQINIPIKQISDTSQYSMPYIGIHPEQNYFAAQSMDNAIYAFSMKPKYKRHPKKHFSGHKCAGFGIGFGFSPDGQYIASGDTRGRVYIWDWKTTHLLKHFDVPDKKTIVTVAWSPQETSKMLCSGNGGEIFLYD